MVYGLYHLLLIPVLVIQYHDWWPVRPFVKVIPPLFLLLVFVYQHAQNKRDLYFRNTTVALVLTALAFFAISFNRNPVADFLAMLLFILGRLAFFLNIRMLSGFLIIKNWKNFLIIVLIAFSFFLFVAVYVIPQMIPMHKLAITLYVFMDTLLVTSVYFLWRVKKLHTTGIWAIAMLVLFDLIGSFSMFIGDFNDHYAISTYFGYLSTYFMYRYMIDLSLGESLKKSDI